MQRIQGCGPGPARRTAAERSDLAVRMAWALLSSIPAQGELRARRPAPLIANRTHSLILGQ